MVNNRSEAKFDKLWFVLSVIVGAAGLFGALYWGPNHDQSTGLYWAIFALMAYQSFVLWQKNQGSDIAETG